MVVRRIKTLVTSRTPITQQPQKRDLSVRSLSNCGRMSTRCSLNFCSSRYVDHFHSLLTEEAIVKSKLSAESTNGRQLRRRSVYRCRSEFEQLDSHFVWSKFRTARYGERSCFILGTNLSLQCTLMLRVRWTENCIYRFWQHHPMQGHLIYEFHR